MTDQFKIKYETSAQGVYLKYLQSTHPLFYHRQLLDNSANLNPNPNLSPLKPIRYPFLIICIGLLLDFNIRDTSSE